jgi:hypothetical protein
VEAVEKQSKKKNTQTREEETEGRKAEVEEGIPVPSNGRLH